MNKNYIQGLLRLFKNNFLSFFKIRPYYFKLSHTSNTYLLKNSNEQIHIAYPNRVGFYFFGISKRIKGLVESFGATNEILLNENDVVIDVGSNIGEFSIGIAKTVKQVYAFDPDPSIIDSFNSNTKSFSNIKHFPFALSEKSGSINFYLKGDTADSSMIENGSDNIVTVPSKRFDTVKEIINLDTIKLFKCDAEGAEPEVLRGFGDIFKKTEYISIDCGFERGISQESTRTDVLKILENNNFKIVNDGLSSNRNIIIAQNKKIVQNL